MSMTQRIADSLIWMLLALIMGACAWFLALEPIAVMVGNYLQSRDYTAVPAQIEKRTARDAEGSYEYLLARYEIGGRSYETNRLSLVDSEAVDQVSNAQVIREVLSRLGGGDRAQVWVSPRRPDIALMNIDLPWRSIWPRMPMAIGFSLLALSALLRIVHALRGRSANDATGLTFFALLWGGFTFPMFAVVFLTEEQVEFMVLAVMLLFTLIGLGFVLGSLSRSLRPGMQTILAGPPARPLKDRAAAGRSRMPASAPGVKRGGFKPPPSRGR